MSEELKNACPTCDARAGYKCRHPSGGTRHPHTTRSPLPWPMRIMNVLVNLGVADVTPKGIIDSGVTWEQVVGSKNMGRKNIKILEDRLKEEGLRLPGERKSIQAAKRDRKAKSLGSLFKDLI